MLAASGLESRNQAIRIACCLQLTAGSSVEEQCPSGIYVDTSKQVGDKDHLKAFATDDAGRTAISEHISRHSEHSLFTTMQRVAVGVKWNYLKADALPTVAPRFFDWAAHPRRLAK
jgi:hypothetical protein